MLLDSLSLQVDCPLFIDQLEAPWTQASRHSYWLSHWAATLLHRLSLRQWAVISKGDDNNSVWLYRSKLLYILYCSILPAPTRCIVTLRPRAFTTVICKGPHSSVVTLNSRCRWDMEMQTHSNSNNYCTKILIYWTLTYPADHWLN